MKARAMKIVPRTRAEGASVDVLKGNVTQPIKTLQLMRLLGVAEASRRLHVSMTTLHKARKHNLVSGVIEVAAQGALQEIATGAGDASVVKQYAPAAQFTQPRTVTFILEVDISKRDFVEKMAQMLGGKLVTG